MQGPTATSAGPTMLYSAATGALSFDADDSGAGSAVLIATLDNHAHLTAAGFLF